jgi:hypothetical protein
MRWRWVAVAAVPTLFAAGLFLSPLVGDSGEPAASRGRIATVTRTITVTPPAATRSSDRVLFKDNFDGPQGSLPNPKDWIALTRCDTNPATNECQDPSAVHLDGAGHLVLEIQNHKCPNVETSQAYCVGRVQTMGIGPLPGEEVLHDFAAPFRMEWTMKMPTIPGSGGVAWSLNTWTTHPAKSDKRDELDVQEGPAAAPDLLRCNLHFGARQHASLVWTGQDLSASFHTYWMEVYATHVLTGMDETACQNTLLPAAHRRDRWGAIVSADVGSCSSSWWVACPNPAANWPDEVVVDSVRVTAIG